MTVLIYVDTVNRSDTPITTPRYLKIFANADAAEARFAENDPKGVAFESARKSPGALPGLPQPAPFSTQNAVSNRIP
jgi:hypothetical protein